MTSESSIAPSYPPLAECLRVLDEHKQARLARLPKSIKKWRREYYWLCPVCETPLACSEPNVLNTPMIDTRNARVVDRGPITLLWPCVNNCRTVEDAL